MNRKKQWFILGVLLTCGAIGAVASGKWRSLQDDDLHDPTNVAIGTLQQPEEALHMLSPDTAGNMVNWVEALAKGEISPRHNLSNTEQPQEVLASKILLKDTSNMPMVLFPHETHTQWMTCSNCHEKLFKSEAGATNITMFEILQGKACGQCHGAVAFPLTECDRCHSVPRDSPQARELLRSTAGAATSQ